MSIYVLFAIAISLAMDAFAVSVACGASLRAQRIRHMMRIALFFGFFQGMMPVIGWFAGIGIRAFIAYAGHWIAFALLCGVGIKMIVEGRTLTSEEKSGHTMELVTLLIISFATSIDALAVGVSMSLLQVDIVQAALVIGCVTCIMSAAGVWLGKQLGHLSEGMLERIAGCVLIGIGVYMLVGHYL